MNHRLTNPLLAAALLAVFVAAAFASVRPVLAQDDGSLRLIVNADTPRDTINKHIYGHFAEHLGRDIYGGFWVQEEAGAGTAQGGLPEVPPSGWQYNEPVLEALRALDIPNVRWPGGCFADYYYWRDGIGPRDERPTMVNSLWGGVTEDNSFGTHEFLELTERLDAEPIVVGNVGSGTVEEMANWWEYVNHPGGSALADERAANGRTEPWYVRFWGVGNESWGCGGAMRPEYYADLYRRFAEFIRPIGDTHPFHIATGASGSDYNWTEVMMREAGNRIDGIDLHHYTITGTWADKGSSTDFTRAQWVASMQSALQMDELLTRHSAIMDQYDPEKRVWLIVGEWGMWHDVESGTEPGFLYQQNTIRDAIVAAATLNIFNQHADRVRMANIAQTINVLQAMILTQGDEMILTPTYHVFHMYKPHMDAAMLPVDLQAGTFSHDGERIPAVSASASQKDGRMHLTLANMDPTQPRTIETSIRGGTMAGVSGRILAAEAMNAHNTFEAPETVAPQSFDGATLDGGTLTVELPPMSVVALELE